MTDSGNILWSFTKNHCSKEELKIKTVIFETFGKNLLNYGDEVIYILFLASLKWEKVRMLELKT